MIYLIRHGETDWSKNHRHTGRTDIPLNDRGRLQAACLRLALPDITFEHVLCSPLERARQTAELAGFTGRLASSLDFTEWDYGDYDGKTPQEIRMTEPDWTPWSHGFLNGETIESVSARVDRVIEQLRCASTAIVFSHGHVLRILTARWLGAPPDFAQHLILTEGSVSVLDREYDRNAIRSWNCAAL